MNRDEIKGKMKDVKGRVQRQAGEWTGDTEQQIKGAGSQLEGKLQQGVGKMKDAGDKAMRDIKSRQNQPRDMKDDKDLRREDEEIRRDDTGRKVA